MTIQTKLLTEIEASDILGIKPCTLRTWRWSGKGPKFRKLGSAVRYHPSDINEYVAAASRTSTSDAGGVNNG